ncbi:MAG: Cellulase, partial [Actinotalea sp.]|nr:Cellulase [Actinotalea sp.]
TPTAAPTTAPAAAAPTGNPFAGQRLYAEPASRTQPGQAAARLRASDPQRAAAFDLLAQQPTVYWYGDWNPNSEVRADVDARLDAAQARGELATILVYNIMKRDSGHYSAGGASSLADYKAWIDQVAAGIGGRRVPVIVEPDAVNDLYNMSGTDRTERAAALRYAITTLQRAGASAYLDGGGVGIHSVANAVPLLKEAGIELARGFALNVANFKRTEDTVAYGRQVAALVGGKPFVVDTARNGNGPLTVADPEPWCNPPGRAIGRTPTTAPATAGVDAFLWVKEPGNSDGECRGFPRAGTFVEAYAYELVVNSRR